MIDKAASTLLENERNATPQVYFTVSDLFQVQKNPWTEVPNFCSLVFKNWSGEKDYQRSHSWLFDLLTCFELFLLSPHSCPLWSTLHRFCFLFYSCFCLFLLSPFFFLFFQFFFFFTHDFAEFTRGKRKYTLIVYNTKTAKTSRMEGVGCFWNANMLSLSIL